MTELLTSTQENTSQQERLFPVVDIATIPVSARIVLEESAESAGFADAEAAGLNKVSELTYPNGDKAYFATYTPVSDEFVVEESTLLIDTTPSGDVSGAANIQFFRKFKGVPRIVGAPFVGYTKTGEDFRRQGLAERRIHAMNTIANTIYNEPLRSGTHQAQEIVPLWEKLVDEGIAIKIPGDSEFSYQFKRLDSDSTTQNSEVAPPSSVIDTVAKTGMRRFFGRKS